MKKLTKLINIDGINYSKSNIESMDYKSLHQLIGFIENKNDLIWIKSFIKIEAVEVYIDNLLNKITN